MPLEDRERFKDLKARLKELFKWLPVQYKGSVELKGYVSRINPNGYSPTDVWGCLYPSVADDKSFGLQVALIIRPYGAELCFCFGKGEKQPTLAKNQAALDATLAKAKARLLTLPDTVIASVSTVLDSTYRFRKQWRGDPSESEFANLSEWIHYAGSDESSGASVSRYFTASELDSLGSGIAKEVESLLAVVTPVLDFVYKDLVTPASPDDPSFNDESEEAGPTDEELSSLAGKLYLSDPKFLIELRDMLFEKGQVVLFGPPGTGKTYIAKQLMAVLATQDRCRIVQFHPSYSYEDFVRGYRPVTTANGLSYVAEDGPLTLIAAQAAADSKNLYVLLIDEINRGNLPRIFGELLYLLEYRDESLDLLYPNVSGQRRFKLPANLLMIATMNTADRSIGVIDVALRRRFHFVELAPNVSPLDGLLRRWLQANQPTMVEVANWVDRLNHLLNKDFPGKQLQVGHSYFMPNAPVYGGSAASPLDLNSVERIWRNDIMPFLQDQLVNREEKLSSYDLPAIRKSASASTETSATEGSASGTSADSSY